MFFRAKSHDRVSLRRPPYVAATSSLVFACLPAAFALAAGALAVPAHAAGIVPDGATATTVTAGANGRPTVNLANAVGGVSNNTYSSFNVGAAGASLNNVGVNALTIVNQVTSTNPSVISGPIAVLGARANVVLANPNGITVDGGSFTNTGHVALSTGQVSFNDINNGGVLQRNVVLTTSQGNITIGAGGLAGTLIQLELISKTLNVNGPVSNTFSSSTGGIRSITGSSTATINTGLSPTDNSQDWLSYTSPAALANSVAVDLSAAGSLSAGSIQLIVTDRGAGVANAGAIYANAGDFTLSSAGNVNLTDGSFKAAGNVNLTSSGQLALQGGTIVAGNNVTASAAGISAVDDASSISTINAQGGGVVLNSSGDIVNTGSLIQGNTRIAGNAQSNGAVSLVAQGNILNSSSAANLGVIFGTNDDVTASAQGNLTNDNARILSNTSINLAAGGTLNNMVNTSGGVNNGQPLAYTSQGGSFLFFTHSANGFNVDYGTLSQPGQIAYIAATGGTVTLSGLNVYNTGGVIQSSASDITINATQAFSNQAVFSGQASYQQSCFIFCSATAASNVQASGGTIQSGGNITITAGQSASNIGGNVAAGGNLTVTAPVTYAQGVLGYTAIDQDRGFKAFFGSTWAELIATDIGGGWSANGLLTLVGQGVINGGSFTSASSTTASNGIVTVRSPSTQPVTLGSHLGLTTWWWQ